MATVPMACRCGQKDCNVVTRRIQSYAQGPQATCPTPCKYRCVYRYCESRKLGTAIGATKIMPPMCCRSPQAKCRKSSRERPTLGDLVVCVPSLSARHASKATRRMHIGHTDDSWRVHLLGCVMITIEKNERRVPWKLAKWRLWRVLALPILTQRLDQIDI